MIRRVRGRDGRIARIEMSVDEAEKLLESDGDDLLSWAELLPYEMRDGERIYSFSSQEDLTRARQRASILRTRVKPSVVRDIEERGLLRAYAGLAEDCPQGLTVLHWRSYAIVVLMQARAGAMLGARELARRANLMRVDDDGKVELDVETAETHLRLLTVLGWLAEDVGKDGTRRWKHKGLPACMRG